MKTKHVKYKDYKLLLQSNTRVAFLISLSHPESIQKQCRAIGKLYFDTLNFYTLDRFCSVSGQFSISIFVILYSRSTTDMERNIAPCSMAHQPAARANLQPQHFFHPALFLQRYSSPWLTFIILMPVFVHIVHAHVFITT